MSTETVLDVSASLVAKSDQLNAADLTGGPIVVRIEAIRRGTGQADPEKQPYELVLSAPWKPWRPCKTMLRLLAALWGTNGAKWTGHTVRLHRDPDVTFGKDEVGGIRMDGADIPKPVTVTLPVRRGQVKRYTVASIEALPGGQKPAPTPIQVYLRATVPTLAIEPALSKEESAALVAYLRAANPAEEDTVAQLAAKTPAEVTAAILTGCGRTKPADTQEPA